MHAGGCVLGWECVCVCMGGGVLAACSLVLYPL